MKKYNGFLIDLDGTMYRGNEVIEDAPLFIQHLIEEGYTYLFLTNNSTRTPKQVAEKLNRMGIVATPNHVFTTSMATAQYIKKQNKYARCFVIGEEGLVTAIKEAGLTIVNDEHCDYVVFGLDREITYEKLATGCIAIQNGARFVSTNGDFAIPSERGLLPGNGSLTNVLTVATGRKPFFIGKPEKVIVNEALKILGTEKAETLLIGDNYYTDIKAGIQANIDTLMVFTGVTSPEQYESFSEKPTYCTYQLKDWLKNL